ncbi:LuxR family transcriptional regulator [Shumkonia mesophila]|uniref:LuxR family transcriptional regulator n=1 Tax=Shumkonia mesophila TaxID=2838854 RepID=UPI0029346C15|nr:LuxR family transcriptional regulator [Shumkonia mesophila]
MHRIFQSFVDHISESVDPFALRATMADTAAALDLCRFAYLSVPPQRGADALVISTYPPAWTTHYLESHYERLDPVVLRARRDAEPFDWGLATGQRDLSGAQRQFFDEAAEFGIRCGFTIPIHDSRGLVAAVTFAANEPYAAFRRAIDAHAEGLQLMAMYFHVHVRRKLAADRLVDGVTLSPREYECLAWAAQGKSAWEIGRILGISRRTAAFHLENAKAKLGVRSIAQAVVRLAASRSSLN